MADDDLLAAVAAETKQFSDKNEFTPAEYERLKDVVHEDLRPIAYSERSFFIIGSYGDDELVQLRAVQERLQQEGEAFLMRDITDAWEFWTTQFKVLANRATYIVGVFEHTHGGHEWEAGYLDHYEYRHKTQVLKRQYDDEAMERENFDGMFAHYIRFLDRLGRVYYWSDPDDLLDPVIEDLIADLE